MAGSDNTISRYNRCVEYVLWSVWRSGIQPSAETLSGVAGGRRLARNTQSPGCAHRERTLSVTIWTGRLLPSAEEPPRQVLVLGGPAGDRTCHKAFYYSSLSFWAEAGRGGWKNQNKWVFGLHPCLRGCIIRAFNGVKWGGAIALKVARFSRLSFDEPVGSIRLAL
jgi:hypothetical protein